MDNRPIICDTGTGYLKIGWAGDNFPAYSFPTMVGRPMLRYDEKIEGVELKVNLLSLQHLASIEYHGRR